jgi:hypothetical protein
MSKQGRVCVVSVAFLTALILTITVVGAQAPLPLCIGRETAENRLFPRAGIDLDVTYISRAPLYQAYCVEYLMVQVVLDLGFERLESYTDECQRQADDTCMCVQDSG